MLLALTSTVVCVFSIKDCATRIPTDFKVAPEKIVIKTEKICTPRAVVFCVLCSHALLHRRRRADRRADTVSHTATHCKSGQTLRGRLTRFSPALTHAGTWLDRPRLSARVFRRKLCHQTVRPAVFSTIHWLSCVTQMRLCRRSNWSRVPRYRWFEATDHHLNIAFLHTVCTGNNGCPAEHNCDTNSRFVVVFLSFPCKRCLLYVYLFFPQLHQRSPSLVL